ncbi:MAG: hypothetical protein J6M34_05735 [Clostridia bacterium]|nr:hypothetical protein [Clostridia bacterium]
MKRFLCFLLTLVVLFGLVACAGSVTDESTDTGTATGRYPNDGLYTDGLPEVELPSDTDPVTSETGPSAPTSTTPPVSSDVPSDTDSVVPSTDSADEPTETNEKITIGKVTVSTTTNKPIFDDEVKDTKVTLDTSVEHKFFATDITNHSILIFDLNKCGGDLANLTSDKSCIVWEWDADNDSNCKLKNKVGKGIDAAKLRYSNYYKKDVVIACSSTGWAGIIDYNARKVLWETATGVGGAHSIELLPNGDLVVITSTSKVVGGKEVPDGKLLYFPVTAGGTSACSEITTPSGHGVMWDPTNQKLWVLEYEQVFGCKVTGSGNSGKLAKDNTGNVFTGKDTSGHVLMPVLGDPGKYWVAGGDLWKFDAATQSLTRSSHYQSKWMKGVASFSDGVMVQSVPAREAELTKLTTGTWNAELKKYTGYWSTMGFRIWTMEPVSGIVTTYRPVATDIYFSNREFYKVYPVHKGYQ